MPSTSYPKDAGRSGRKSPKPARARRPRRRRRAARRARRPLHDAGSTLSARGGRAREQAGGARLDPSARRGAQSCRQGRPSSPASAAPRVIAVSAALAERVAWDRVLRRFSLVLPDDVWLQSLALTSPPAPARPKRPPLRPPPRRRSVEGFIVTGRTYSHDGVARLLAPHDRAARPARRSAPDEPRRPRANGQEIVEFTIVAGVRPDGESS